MAEYRFEDIAINSTQKKKPVEEDKYHYLGLEHLDSGTFTVSRFGSDVAPIGDKLVMKKGDILFGKRRAYQKKVAIAPFDGIFSAHGMVLRPKEDVIDKDFFPLFIASDYFLDAAIKISVGSLSPTINWRDLKELKFNLPSLPEQKKLAETLWSIVATMESYKKLLAKTDEMVKAKFVEMFEKCDVYETIGNLFSLVRNGANIKQSKDIDGFPITRIETISNKTIDRNKMGYAGIHDIEKYSDYILHNYDILISHINSIPHMGKSALFIKNEDETIIHGMNLLLMRPILEKINPIFIYQQMNFDEFLSNIQKITKPAVNQASFTASDLKQIKVKLPTMIEQEKFATFVQKSEESKSAIQASLDSLTQVYKKIIAENLGGSK